MLKDAQGKTIKVRVAEVERLVPQSRSLMPELLLRDLTAQQVADLLEYPEHRCNESRPSIREPTAGRYAALGRVTNRPRAARSTGRSRLASLSTRWRTT